MLAVRDQENLVHTHQTAAASKPLNQGLKQLHPKTPGPRAPKTPFKGPLNDENNPFAFGKTVKTNAPRNGNAKLGRDAFVTPSGPQSRAPLGMKTTNAKARGLQTPAPLKDTVKPETTDRLSTVQRIKKASPVVYQTTPAAQTKEDEDEVPDIEYMPPKPKELPDFPDEITYDTTFPQFQPKNRALGLESTYRNDKAIARRQREYEERLAAYDKMAEETIMKQLDSVDLVGNDGIEDFEVRPTVTEERRATRAATGARPDSRVSTIRSREAANALTGMKPAAGHARTASSSKPRSTSSFFGARKTRTPTPTNPSSMRHTAAVVSSKTTLGYSRGRNVSSTLQGKTATTKTTQAVRRPLSPRSYLATYGPPPLGSEMWGRCRAAGCFGNEDEDEGLGDDIEDLPSFVEDEETRNFQLTL